MSEHILEIRHLSKAFGTHAVLKDIDFTVDKGDVTTIIGASGSGKSTLLRCINLLETLTTGEIPPAAKARPCAAVVSTGSTTVFINRFPSLMPFQS